MYLLLGEEFDRDPFLIFRMRGMDREDLLGPEFRRSAQTLEGPTLPAEPLPPEPGEFWTNPLTALREKDHAGPAIIPELAAALPQQLGRFPLWQGNREFVPTMQDIYRTASQRAVELLMGPAEPPGNPAPERRRSRHGHNRSSRPLVLQRRVEGGGPGLTMRHPVRRQSRERRARSLSSCGWRMPKSATIWPYAPMLSIEPPFVRPERPFLNRRCNTNNPADPRQQAARSNCR